MKELFYVYRTTNGTSSTNDEPVFKSRQGGGGISLDTAWRVMSRTAKEMNITKRVGSNTLRKTYFMHVYETEDNKTAALLFLDRLNGGSRLYNIADYLDLPEAEPDYGHFFSDAFALGQVNVSRIRNLFANKEHVQPLPEQPERKPSIDSEAPAQTERKPERRHMEYPSFRKIVHDNTLSAVERIDLFEDAIAHRSGEFSAMLFRKALANYIYNGMSPTPRDLRHFPLAWKTIEPFIKKESVQESIRRHWASNY